MSGNDCQLVCYSTIWNKHIASVYHPYNTFRQFFFALYLTQTYCLSQFFNKAYSEDLVTHASLWHHNGNRDVKKLLWQLSVAMLSVVADLKQFYKRFSAYTHLNLHKFNMLCPGYHDRIEIDISISVTVVSPTTWEAHHSPRTSPSCCGELPRSLVTPQWPQSWYQFP